MNFHTVPSFRKDDSLIQLVDFLMRVPDNNLTWSVLDFYGIGTAPDDLSMEEFEELARSKPSGYIMTWAEVQNFAYSLFQTYDCLIVAAKSPEVISGNRAEKKCYSNCEVVIEAFDRTEWSVWARDEKVMNKFRSIQ